MKLPDRSVRVLNPERARNHRFGHGGAPASSCPITALVQLDPPSASSFCVSPSEQLGDGHAGPCGSTTSAMSSSSTPFASAAAIACAASEFFRLLLQMPLEFHSFPVLELGGAIQVVLALRLFDCDLGLLYLLASWRQPLGAPLLGLPARGERVGIRRLRSASSFSSLPARFADAWVFLFAQRFALDLELHDAAPRFSSISAGMESISVRRRAAASSTRSIALSGRKAVGDVAAGEKRPRPPAPRP
jgi:hypothetical protein